jgi:hypothetical protein
MGSKENRRAKRTAHDSVLELFDSSGQMIAGIGRLVNVSSVGVCFSCVKPLAQGEKIQGRLRLLKEGFLDIKGHVVWIRKRINATLYGVEFDNVRPFKTRRSSDK